MIGASLVVTLAVRHGPHGHGALHGITGSWPSSLTAALPARRRKTRRPRRAAGGSAGR